jgi:hypothetical protein
MSESIINCHELNVNDIKMYPPRPTGGGGKNVGMMNKRTNAGIRLQLPMMFTYGASDYEGNKNYSFGLQFPADMDDPSIDPLHVLSLNKLIEFETYLKAKVFQHSKEWTQRTMKDQSMVDMIWSPMLKYPLKADKSEKDMTRSPSLNVKIPCWENKWSSEVYDEEGECLFSAALGVGESPLEFFTKGAHVIAVIQCGGIYVVSGKVGVTWKLIQAVVKQSNTSISGRCLVKLPEHDRVKFVSTPAPLLLEESSSAPSSPKSTSSSLLGAGDNDEEEDDALPSNPPTLTRLNTEPVEEEEEKFTPIITKPRRGRK